MERKDFAHRFPHLAAGLPDDDADALIAALHGRSLVQGDVLIEEGAPSAAAFLVFDGTLGVTVGVREERVSLGRVEPGDLVGEVSFVDGGPASATLTAQGPVTVLEVTPRILDELLRTHPRAAAAVQRQACEALARHLRSASDELLDLQPERIGHTGANEGLLEALRGLLGLKRS